LWVTKRSPPRDLVVHGELGKHGAKVGFSQGLV
jgi:hypothetical protein